jgi:hypothetical protein
MDTGVANWARLMLTLRSSVTAFGRRTQVAQSHIILRHGVRVEEMRQRRGAARCKIQRCRGRREQQDKARRRTVSARKCWCSCWCHGKARYSHAVHFFCFPSCVSCQKHKRPSPSVLPPSCDQIFVSHCVFSVSVCVGGSSKPCPRETLSRVSLSSSVLR